MRPVVQLLICMSAYVGQLSHLSTFLPGAASARLCPTSSFPRLRCPESVGPARWGGSAAHGGLETCGCLAGFCFSSSWQVVVGRAASSSALAQGCPRE